MKNENSWKKLLAVMPILFLVLACNGNKDGGGSSNNNPGVVAYNPGYVGQPGCGSGRYQGYNIAPPGRPFCSTYGFVPTEYGCAPICPADYSLASYGGGYCNIAADY